MNVNKYNSERYCDPTAYEAISNIIREEKKFASKEPPGGWQQVYICSQRIRFFPDECKEVCKNDE